MRKFEIEFKQKEDFEYSYNVKSEGFESIVSIFHFRSEQAFVHKHTCTKGVEQLCGFNFWNELQKAVLKYHNLKMEEVK